MDMSEHNPTNINQEVGYLGPHEKIFDVGNAKHMLLQEGDNIPLCMTPQEHADKNFVHYNEPQLKYKTKAELIGNIKSAGTDISILKWKRLGELQDISHKNPISVTKIIRKESVKV